jgi:GDP-L-fucose synthase
MIVVTGGSGFLGRAVAAHLPDAVALSSKDLDLTDGRMVHEAFSDWRPEVVIHLAARVGGITANIAHQADFLVDNLRIDGNLLSALRTARPAHLISMLSTCMYPDRLPAGSYPMREDMLEDGPPPPTNASYAAAKRALWHGTRALHAQYSVPYSAVIPANLYGPGDHFGDDNSHFLAAAIHKIESARKASADSVDFMGTGVAERQYVLASDLAWLVAELALGEPLNETINVAPTGASSIRELALAVAAAAGYRGEVRFSGTGPDGQLRKDVSSARLRSLLPSWSANETSLSEGLDATIDWYREHVEAG